MKDLIAFFVQRPLLVNLGLVFDFAAGIASLNPAVFSAYPEFSTLASILS